MRKYLLTMIGLGMFLSYTNAQDTPKWAEKAKKAVFSVITYDKTNKIKNTGNGFFTNTNGTALSDYSLFEGAEKAVIVNGEGKEIPVQLIMGANSMYDVIKFKVTPDKKSVSLPIAAKTATVGETVYLLPYSTQKEAKCQSGKIIKIDSIGDKGFYYTLDMKTTAKTVSCPVMNANGEVIGLIQKSASDDEKESYAISASMAESLNITALSSNDANLNNINIKKAIPEAEDQALVYIMMGASQMSDSEYLETLNDFIAQFPNSTEGYLKRAAYYMNMEDEESWALANNDIKKAESVSKTKNETQFNISKLIYSYAISLGNKKQNPEWSYQAALDILHNIMKSDAQPIYIQLEGDIYFAMKKYADAFNSYEKVTHTNLASSATFFSASKAKQLTEGADMNEALALLDSAIVRFTKPYVAEAGPYFYERADLKAKMGKHRDAVTDYNTFYDIAVGNVNADFYYQREQSEVQCKMYQQAIDDMNKAIELAPKDAAIWTEMGSLYIRVAQFQNAIDALEKAKEIDAKDAAIYRMIGYSQIQLKNKKDGLVSLTKAKELGDTVAEGLIDKYCK